jgi:hypothetical protein
VCVMRNLCIGVVVSVCVLARGHAHDDDADVYA